MKYLGTTVTFPIVLVNGKATLTEGVAAVEQSILDIMNTLVGTVFFNRLYGGRIEELIFEPNDDVLKSLLTIFIEDAMVQWEKRTKFVDTYYEIDDAAVRCYIMHNIIGLNKLTTTVFTFYRKS